MLITIFVVLCLLGFIFRKHFWAPQATSPDAKKPINYFQGVNGLRLSMIVFVAILIRICGLSFGLSHGLNPEEKWIADVVGKMLLSGELNTNDLSHPSMIVYAGLGVGKIGLLLSSSSDELSRAETILYAGRFLSALSSAGCVVLIFALGAVLYSPAVGLSAAVIFALSPLSVFAGRSFTESSLLVFFALAASLAGALSLKQKRPELLLAAGPCAGFAAATGYQGILCLAIIPLVIASPGYERRLSKEWMSTALGGALLAAICFLLGSPYSVFALSNLIGAEGNLLGQVPKSVIVSGAYCQIPFMHTYFLGLVPAIGWVGALLVPICLGSFVADRRSSDVFIVMLILLFYLPAAFFSRTSVAGFDPNLLACFAFLSILVPAFVDRLGSNHLSKGKYFLVFTTILLVAEISVRTILYTVDLNSDTREQASEWLRQQVPSGSGIAVLETNLGLSIDTEQIDVTYADPADCQDRTKIDPRTNYIVTSSLGEDRCVAHEDGSNEGSKHQCLEGLSVVAEFGPQFGAYGYGSPTIRIYTARE